MESGRLLQGAQPGRKPSLSFVFFLSRSLPRISYPRLRKSLRGSCRARNVVVSQGSALFLSHSLPRFSYPRLGRSLRGTLCCLEIHHSLLSATQG